MRRVSIDGSFFGISDALHLYVFHQPPQNGYLTETTLNLHCQRPAAKSRKKQWACLELPVIDYQDAWDLQHKLVRARRDGSLERDVILVLEHTPVFTLGRRGGRDHLAVTDGFLKKQGIPLIPIERGGLITFHGPGQLVVYPIIDLRKARLPVGDYIAMLEEVMIRLCAQWGIEARRNNTYRGIWVKYKKLGSVGVAIRRGVSFHGLALNINLSLEPFSWISPCGLQGVQMTSIKKELGKDVSMTEVRQSVRFHIKKIFGVQLDRMDLKDIHGL
jgi:lipoate-protein ligase B